MTNLLYDPINKEQLWILIEQKIPGIKDIFEIYTLSLRMCNYHEAFTTVTNDYNKLKQKLLKIHLYSSISHKIFTLYYNLNTDYFYVRNLLNEDKRLITSSEKIQVKSLKDLKELLQQSVINL